MSFWKSIFGSSGSNSIDFEGESYPVFSGRNKFFDECRFIGKAAYRVTYGNYWTVLRAGHDKGILDCNAKIVCKGCNAPPPFSFLIALDTDDLPSTNCPRCGSATGFIVWNGEAMSMASAIGKGDIDTVRLMLRRGVPLNEPDDYGCTPLMYAAEYGKRDIFEWLLRRGADPDFQTEDGSTVLMAAMSVYTDPEIVRALLDRNVAIDVQTSSGWSALMYAAKESQYEVVRELLDRGAATDLKNQNDESALTIALNGVGTELADMLIDAGAAVNQQDKKGWTALMLAADQGHAGIVAKLLKRGADPNLETKDERVEIVTLRQSGTAGQSALTLAVQTGTTIYDDSDYREIIDALLDAGADVNHRTGNGWTALWTAVWQGHTEIASKLLERGAVAGPKSKVGGAVLPRAILGEHDDLARALLDAGADVKEFDDDGWTPVIAAAARGMTGLAELLLDRGAPIDGVNKHGASAIGRAASNEDAETFALLAERGATVDLDSDDGMTAVLFAAERGQTQFIERHLSMSAESPLNVELAGKALRIAAAFGNDEIVRSLLDHGIPVDNRDVEGLSALMYAANSGQTVMVAALLDRGAALDAQSDDGWAALILAAEKDHRDTVEVLIERGAAIDTCINQGWSALMFAVNDDHADIAKLLLKNGADPNRQSDEGRTALMIAAERNDVNLVRSLLDHGASADQEDSEGRTAQELVREEGHYERYKAVQKALARASSRDKTAPAKGEEPPGASEPDEHLETDVHGDSQRFDLVDRKILQTDPGEHGQYLKQLFDHVRTEFQTSPFKYEDLPPAPSGLADFGLFDEDDTFEVIEVGSAADRDKSPFLEELQEVGFIVPAGPMKFMLTDVGRVSSIVVDGTDSSGYLVFDYSEMDSLYGHQAFREIKKGLQGITGMCAFHDGDVSASVLEDMLPNAARIIPMEGREWVFSGEPVRGIGPYVVAMWTDAEDAFSQLHEHLCAALSEAYVGYMTLGATYRRDDFERAISRQLLLTPATEFVCGRVTSATEKYFT
ncbi:MAG: ankyrin repeat domain-containing protein [Gammaproteobacteria bacterium]